MNGPITDALRTVRAGKTAAAVALLAVAAVSLAVSLAVVATGPALPIADDSADGLTPATDGPTPAAGESGAESAVVEGVAASFADGYVCLREVGVCRTDGAQRCTYEVTW